MTLLELCLIMAYTPNMSKEGNSPADQRLLEPIYWNNHAVGDECKDAGTIRSHHSPTPSYIQQLKADLYASRILKEYLQLADKQPARPFLQGQVFNQADFPIGTVIKFTAECLDITHMSSQETQSYRQTGYWGVVASYAVRGEIRPLLMHSPIAADSILQPFFVDYPTITVGEVLHQHIVNKKENLDKFERVNHLELHKLGTGVKQEVRSRVGNMSFRTIFKPTTQH